MRINVKWAATQNELIMKISMRLLFTTSLILALFWSCGKFKVKKNCCKITMTINPSYYNSDSVGVYVPNAFTPNADGINDNFGPKLWGINSIEFKIYKGKNNLVFQTTKIYEWWNGEYKGKPKTGIFRYEMQLITKHGESLSVEGEFCSLLDPYTDGTNLQHCTDCQYGDMANPMLGFIYETAERLENCD